MIIAAADAMMARRNTSRGMNQERVQRANRDQVMTFYPSSRVKEQHRKTLAFGVKVHRRRNMCFPILRGFVGCVAKDTLIGHRALAECHAFCIPLGFHTKFREAGHSSGFSAKR